MQCYLKVCVLFHHVHLLLSGNFTFVYHLRILDFLSFAGTNFSKFGFQTLLILQGNKKEFVAHYLGQKCRPLKSHNFQFNLTVS